MKTRSQIKLSMATKGCSQNLNIDNKQIHPEKQVEMSIKKENQSQKNGSATKQSCSQAKDKTLSKQENTNNLNIDSKPLLCKKNVQSSSKNRCKEIIQQPASDLVQPTKHKKIEYFLSPEDDKKMIQNTGDDGTASSSKMEETISPCSQNNMISPLLKSIKTQAEDVKINLGSFVQKYENVSEYLDKFTSKVRVGSGHYSEVFKLLSDDKDKCRAMKIIKKEKIPFNEKESFLREVQILKRLDHPNILKLFEFLEDESCYYLITELCDGIELFDVIQNNSDCMTEKDIASIVQQILHSLAYAHSNKIMHRDIKPENIMVSQHEDNYSIKILDWGIGGDFASNDATLATKCGTPYYAAPEVIKKKYNEKCDIWSTGVILYTLLVQEIPFNGDSTTDIILNVLSNSSQNFSNIGNIKENTVKFII